MKQFFVMVLLALASSVAVAKETNDAVMVSPGLCFVVVSDDGTLINAHTVKRIVSGNALIYVKEGALSFKYVPGVRYEFIGRNEFNYMEVKSDDPATSVKHFLEAVERCKRGK